MRYRLLACAAVALCGLSFAPAGAAERDLELHLSGAPEIVLDPAKAGCRDEIIPDAGARAFRDAGGTVHLIAAHSDAIALVGPSLDRVAPACPNIFESHRDGDPARFADRSWPTSFYTEDGRTIFALLHNEHQGHRDPASCPSREYRRCWYNAVTAGISRDGGRSFRLLDRPDRLVAAIPYRYAGDRAGKPVGYFSPSNIVKLDGFHYALVFAESFGAQERGVCVIRTSDLADADAWRAWDGQGFRTRFIDPYAATATAAEPDRHVCAPIRKAGLAFPITGLVRHAPSGLFVAVMSGTAELDGALTSGIFYSVSPDLLDWTPIRVLAASAEMALCRRANRLYPSIIDPDSASPNFETVDDTAELYAVRYPSDRCNDDRRRVLARRSVAIRAVERSGS